MAQNRDEHSQAAESKAFFDFGTLLATSPDTSLRFAVELNRSGRAELDGRKIAGSDRTAALFEFGAASVVLPEILMDLKLGAEVGRIGSEAHRSMRITQQVNAPRAVVYRALLDPRTVASSGSLNPWQADGQSTLMPQSG